MTSWSKAIHGYMFDVNPDVSPTDDTYYREELNKLKKEKDFLDILENSRAPIEYINSTESDYILIAKDYRTIDKNYTHCEIESSLILSAVTLIYPFQNILKLLEMYFHLNKLNKLLECIQVPIIQDLIHLHTLCIIHKNNWLRLNIRNTQM